VTYSWKTHHFNCQSRKLSSTQIVEIKRRYAEGESGPKLAREFGVTTTTIYNYVKGTR
jgi:hypothetical protein